MNIIKICRFQKKWSVALIDFINDANSLLLLLIIGLVRIKNVGILDISAKVELYLFIQISIHIHSNSYKNMACKKITLITIIAF